MPETRQLFIEIEERGSQVAEQAIKDLDKAVDQLEKDVERAGQAHVTMGQRVATVASGVRQAWQTIGATQAITSLAQEADKLVKMAEQTGIGIEALQKFKFAAEQSGNSLQQVVSAIGQMSRRLGGEEGGESVVKALEALGLNFDNIKKMNAEQAFITISEAIARMPPDFDRAKVAGDLFGSRLGQEIIPTLTSKLRELGDEAPLMKEKHVRSLAETGDEYEKQTGRIRAVIGSWMGTIVDTVGPTTAAIASVLGGVLTTLGLLWPAISSVAAAFGGWAAIGSTLGTVLSALTGPIGLTIAAVAALIAIWVKWGDDIKAAVSQQFAVVKYWVLDKFEDVKSGVSSGLTTMRGYWTSFTEKTGEIVTDFMGDMKEWFGPKIKAIFEATKAIVTLFVTYHTDMIRAVTTKVTDLLRDITEWFGSRLRSIFTATKAIIDLFITYHVTMIQTVLARISEFFAALTDWFGAKLRAIVSAVQGILAPIVTFFTTVKDQVIAQAQALYTGVYNWLVTQFQNIVAGIKGKIDSVIGFFNDMYMKVVGGSIVVDMMDGIAEQFGPRLQSVMVAPAGEATDDVVTSFNSMGERVNFEDFINKWGTALDDIQAKTVTFKDVIGGVWDGIKDAIGERIDGIKRAFAESIEGMLNGTMTLREGLTNIWEEIKSAVVRTVLDMIANILTEFIRAIGIIKTPVGPTGPGAPTPPTTPTPTPTTPPPSSTNPSPSPTRPPQGPGEEVPRRDRFYVPQFAFGGGPGTMGSFAAFSSAFDRLPTTSRASSGAVVNIGAITMPYTEREMETAVSQAVMARMRRSGVKFSASGSGRGR